MGKETGSWCLDKPMLQVQRRANWRETGGDWPHDMASGYSFPLPNQEALDQGYAIPCSGEALR